MTEFYVARTPKTTGITRVTAGALRGGPVGHYVFLLHDRILRGTQAERLREQQVHCEAVRSHNMSVCETSGNPGEPKRAPVHLPCFLFSAPS